MIEINNPVRAGEVDDSGTLPVNFNGCMLGVNQLPDDARCRDCGHALVEHDSSGECWHIQDWQGGDTPCSCWWFEPPVQYNAVALEYIGAAFLVWAAAQSEIREMLWERDERWSGE